ncbi:MAG TPA: prolipoprotein diacylglyceryl transferase [Chthonomonadales bacterium]|nr:prolipoprotein diacylglyceryl transferase [Chthonomonadales bacterium]
MHPILFEIGPLQVRAYGTAVLVGFLVGLAYAVAAARRQLARRPPRGCHPITPEHTFDFAVGALLVSVLGARALYVALDWHEFRDNPLEVLRFWTGGLSVHGAILAGLAYMAWFCRRRKLSFPGLADICAPAFTLGYVFGRIGCFLNGCCYGAASELPWAMQFAAEGAVGHLTVPSHPAQLYAGALSLISFAILHLWSRRPHRRGEILLGCLLIYATSRYIAEEFRAGATANLLAFGITHAQAISLAAIPVLALLLVRLRRARVDPQEEAPEEA